jgi:hypothetical protein
MHYSAAAGLGAFAFGQTASDVEGAIVYTDLGGIVVNRGDPSPQFDIDGDGYDDFFLANTNAGGIGGIGSVQLRGSAHPGWYGTPGSSTEYPNAGATYIQIDFDAPSTKGVNAYYVRSFIDGHIIGPSNPKCVDETPGSFGDLYGLLSQYPGWNQNSFWNPAHEPWASNGTVPEGVPDNEYAGLRVVDTNGDTRYGWIRFKVTLHDTANAAGFPFPDGLLTQHDLRYDTNRFVTIYDYAIEMTPDTDIIAGDKGCSLVGDLNCDGFVGIADLNIVLGNWNQTVAVGDPLLGDPSGDGFVGIADLNTVLGNWNAGTPPISAVPEPGALGLLAAGAGALSLKRRRWM